MDYYSLTAIITVLWGIVAWLFKAKDAAQGRELEELRAAVKKETEDLQSQISLLFKKHDDDVAALQELRIAIAEGHYKKGELDIKFDKLELAFKEGFITLGSKFDKLSEILVNHVTIEDRERLQGRNC